MTGLDDFESLAARDVDDAPGDDAPEDAAPIRPFPDPTLDACPVVPLGFIGGKVVFAMPEGEIRTEAASKIGTMLRTDIFACAAGQSFLTTWRDSEDKFQRDLATIWFVRKCREAGPYDLNRPVRDLGVWPGPGDTVVLHRGVEIIEIPPKGKALRLPIAEALRKATGPLYRLRPRAPMPEGKFSAADGAWFSTALSAWNFDELGRDGLTGADVVMGFVGAGMLGAVAPFRGHVLLHAMAGSGKTTLMHLVQALMSALAGEVIDDFTEAGLRGALAGMARPVLLDETEAEEGVPGGGAVARALDLIRRMSTGKGATRKQGSTDGSGATATQTAVGSVMMAAINPPLLNSQDASRFVEVRLKPLPPGGKTDADLHAMVEKAQALAPALLARTLRLAWRYRADVALLKAAFAELGEAPRGADLIAMVAAGRRLLLFDEALTPETAAEEAAAWAPLISERIAQDRVSNPGVDALAHLMAADSGQHVRDRRATLGELVERSCGAERGEYADVLKAHGLIVEQGELGRWRLLIANSHPALERIFRGSKWPDWIRAMTHIDVLGEGYVTERVMHPRRFGGLIRARCLSIPLAPWLESVVVKGGGVPGHVPGGVPGEDYDFA